MTDSDEEVQFAKAGARIGIALLYKYPREVIIGTGSFYPSKYLLNTES